MCVCVYVCVYQCVYWVKWSKCIITMGSCQKSLKVNMANPSIKLLKNWLITTSVILLPRTFHLIDFPVWQTPWTWPSAGPMTLEVEALEILSLALRSDKECSYLRTSKRKGHDDGLLSSQFKHSSAQQGGKTILPTRNSYPEPPVKGNL